MSVVPRGRPQVPFARVLLLAALAALAPPARAGAGQRLPADLRIVLTQLPPGTAAERAGPRSGGVLPADWGEGARLVLVREGRIEKVLTPGFAAAADPEVSLDGTRVLFAGKRAAADRWALFEVDPAGGAIRTLFEAPDDLRSPVLLPTVHNIVADPARGTEPREQVGFLRTFAGTSNEFGDAPASALCTVRTDGTLPRRLTWSPSNDGAPAVLEDGRLVFTAWRRATLDHGPGGRAALVSLNADGTDPAEYAAEEGLPVKSMPCATPAPGRLLAFVEPRTPEWDGAGPLSCVSLRRNLHSHRRITADGDGLFHSPSALPDGTLLAARRPAGGGGTHGVVRIDPATGALDPVFDDPAFHDLQPRALLPRPAPDGRSSAVRDPDEERGEAGGEGPPRAVPTGTLYGLDLRLHDLGGDLPPETFARLRIVEGLPARAGAGPADLAPRRLVGEAPVEADGSFHAVVPADVPLQVQILDGDGLALRSSGWIWVARGARQGCLGCHEDGERTPSNRFVDALGKPGVNLVLPPERRRTVDFENDIAPLLGSRCAPCHGAGAALPLDGPEAFAALRRFVDPGRARTSPLLWHLFGRNTSRPWDGAAAGRAAPPMPAGPGPTPAERRLFAEWVDLGAERAAGPGAGPPGEGRGR